MNTLSLTVFVFIAAGLCCVRPGGHILYFCTTRAPLCLCVGGWWNVQTLKSAVALHNYCLHMFYRD